MSSIEEIGEPAIDPRIQAPKDENETIRQGAVLLLGRIGDALVIKPLAEAMKDDSPFVEIVTKEALEKIRGKTNSQWQVIAWMLHSSNKVS